MRVLPPPAPKIIPRLLSGRKCSGASNCGRLGRRVLAPTLCDRYRASLHVVLALLVSHRAKLWASTITHPCVCGRWGRRVLAPTAICAVASCNGFVWLPLCILAKRLCATTIVHPLHVYERSVGFASCLVNRLGCHIVWQLSAADFKHPCLKLRASTITHPCVCGRLGRRVLAPTLCTAIVHPCTSCLLCWFRIVPRQPFGLPHRVATKCG